MALLLCPLCVTSQERPLERAFTRDTVTSYQVQLTVRTEAEGLRPVRIGVQTYVEPYSLSAEFHLSWRATRRVVAVAPDGSADIEETLEEIKLTPGPGARARGEEAEKLHRALEGSLSAWAGGQHTLRFTETRRGQLTGTLAEGGPVLDSEPAVLTLWLRRALRPTAPLPPQPAIEGSRWQEPRGVTLPPWTDVRGSESGEWLAGPASAFSAVRSVNLHVTQHISGSVPLEKGENAASERVPLLGRFHAESLSTLADSGSPAPGHVFRATRSAVRELTSELDAVAGRAEPTRFRARTSVQIQISVRE